MSATNAVPVCARRTAPPMRLRIRPSVYEYPRALRKYFSDPVATHVATGIPGRGTEESKSNDVTLRCGPGGVGVAIEIGRPTIGMSLRDAGENHPGDRAGGGSQDRAAQPDPLDDRGSDDGRPQTGTAGRAGAFRDHRDSGGARSSSAGSSGRSRRWPGRWTASFVSTSLLSSSRGSRSPKRSWRASGRRG